MTFRTAATAVITLSAVLTVGACTGSSEESTTPSVDTSSETSADFNEADVMFASMMIVHHEQAIEMSDIVLNQEGVDPRVTSLAEDIKAAQTPEIEQLRSWLEAWGVGPGELQMDDMGHGGGMMSEDELTALEEADGPEATHLFLEQMIVHHEGAVDMAETQVDQGSNPDAIELAQTIIDAQTAEIEEMRGLLASS
ncbi:DUF305 domain-containing protein [Serinicoccus kebangsaanensis]|uniref:DUF305 domain-containing protein n=1 Tax=Serinicoccus kebangsaanensis TaxID=2602069 RepID=UPI00124E184F|nr:DUF305 domain-containing protein [Serinicoccus kebangsaanensis]